MTHYDPTENEQNPLTELDRLDSKLWIILQDEGILEALRPEQIQALIPVARGDTIESVASRVGRGEKTIDRWLKEEAFRKAVSATVSFIYTYGLRSCAIATVEAVEVLREAVRDKHAKMSDRIRAAAIIIEQGDRWQNLRLEEKLTELEQRIAMQAGNAAAVESDDDEEGDED